MPTLANSNGDITAVAHQFPASLSQKRIYASAQMRPHSLLLRCEGELNAVALEESLRDLIVRYEVLRTTVCESGGELVQVVSAPTLEAVTVLDLSALQEKLRQRSVDAVLAKFRAGESSALLFRAMLVRLSAREHLCAISAHPLIADEFTLTLLMDELESSYTARLAGEAPHIEAPELQFADFSIWQASQSFSCGREMAEKLAGFFVISSAGQTSAKCDLALSASLAQRLREYAIKAGVEVCSIALSAVAHIHSERSGRERLLLAMVDGGRYGPSLARMPGPMAHTQMLPWPSSEAADFLSRVAHLNAQSLADAEIDAANVGGQLPYELLRNLILHTASPQYWIDLVYLPGLSPGQRFSAGGLPVHIEQASPAHPDARISLRIHEQQDGVSLVLESEVVPESELRLLIEGAIEFLEETFAADATSSVPVQKVLTLQKPAPPSGGQSAEVIQQLRSIWTSVFGISSVEAEDNFFDLGGHSLLAVRLAAHIEKSFGIEIPLHWILEHPTIAELAILLEKAPETETEKPAHTLVPLHTGGLLSPLYWVPGGRAVSVMALREVSMLMGSDRSVYGLESRLPQPGESFLPVPERARIYVELIRRHQPRGPYLLAGFCMGGMVALEVAQQIIQAGQEVGFLGMVQASVPGFPDTPGKRRKMDAQRRSYMMRTAMEFVWTRLLGERLGYSRERRQAVLDRMASLMMGWVSTSSQLPEETQSENSSIMRAYRPTRYRGKIHIYLAKDCYESVGMACDLDPRQRWSAIAEGGSETFVVPGNHSTILTQPHARNLAEAISRQLPQ